MIEGMQAYSNALQWHDAVYVALGADGSGGVGRLKVARESSVVGGEDISDV
jgi:hypothetical protein